MPISPEQLDAESTRATEMLAGKIVARILRHRSAEVIVVFSDGTRLFIDRTDIGVELSITNQMLAMNSRNE